MNYEKLSNKKGSIDEDYIMTIVEIFDEEVVDNISSSLKFNNDKIIYIGFDEYKLRNSISNIHNFFKSIGRKIDIDYIVVEKNNLNNIIEELVKIISRDKIQDYIFDVSGGSDLILVGMGIVAERYNISFYTMDVYNGKAIWQFGNKAECIISENRNEISVRENIILHGGDIVEECDNKEVSWSWDFNDEFVDDIYKMWSICKKDCAKWNREISELQQRVNKSNSLLIGKPNRTMEELVDEGLLKEYSNHADKIYSFKNDQVKEALMKVGNILELYVCLSAMRMKNPDGTNVFNDVKVGVNIDWDGVIHDIHDAKKDTRNEIDVIMMKGIQPIFVSCKNGDVGIDELYKLNTVAERFGGKYAKKVLVATYFGKKGTSQEYFLQRARDMKINVIGGVHKMKDGELIKELSK